MSVRHHPFGKIQKESLHQAVDHIHEESRVILPGVQALFGFQLVAVFSTVFQEWLNFREQLVHFLATVLVSLAFGLILAPAAYHRRAEPESISEKFVVFSSYILKLALIPLMIAVCLELYLIGLLTIHDSVLSLIFAGVVLVILMILWIIFPNTNRLDDQEEKKHSSDSAATL